MTSDDVWSDILKKYVSELIILNQSINLTGTKTFEKAWDLHVRDSAAILQLKLPKPQINIDLGSGNGFPGVFIAARYPNARVVLVERVGKKAKAIRELAQASDLSNVEVHDCDGRELLAKCPELKRNTDLITARAVATLDKMIPICAPWLSKRGQMVFWKSQKLSPKELNEGRKIAAKNGFKSVEKVDYKIDEFRGGCFVIVRKYPPS